MANHLWNAIKAVGRNRVLVHGSFAPDTANPPTAVRGSGFSVVRASQGLFTITFTDPFPALESAVASLQLAAAAARFVQVAAYDATAKTMQIRVVDGAGAVQDIAANNDNRINFAVVFKNAV